MSVLQGKIKPLHDNIMVSHIEFGMEQTRSGILLHSDNGKGSGIHPRWAKVFSVGDEQKDVKVGEWILLEHGRWSRGLKYLTDSGEELTLHLADKNAILICTDEKPDDVMRSAAIGAGSNVNLNIPGM